MLRLAALLLPLAACTAGCPVPGTMPATLLRLYFGRNIPNRPPLTEPEWQRFVGSEIAPRFPQGFTVLDASGEWQSPATGAVARETTRVLEVVTTVQDLPARTTAIVAAYRRRFRQEAVGQITMPVCRRF